MLLIFFLVTSSMYVDKGLLRRLPPKDSDTSTEQIIVDRENIMSLTLTADGQVLVDDSLTAPAALPDVLCAFILSRREDHLFTLEAAPACPYETYFLVQNALTDAYRAARQTVAQETYGCEMTALDAASREQLLTLLPHRVAESYQQEDDR